MIRRNQRQLNAIHSLTDILLIALAYLITEKIAFSFFADVSAQPFAIHLMNAFLMGCWTFFLLKCLNVYRVTRLKKRFVEIRNILLGNALAVLILAAMLYLLRWDLFPRNTMILFYFFSCCILILKRLVMRQLLRAIRKNGYNLKHILLVGSGSLAEQYQKAVAADESLGIRISDTIEPGSDITQQLEEKLHGAGIDEVVLALATHELDVIVPAIQQCEKSGTRVSVVPFFNAVIPTRPVIDVVGDVKLIQLRTTPLDQPVNKMLKRLFDVSVSFSLLLLFLPLLLLIALAIRLSSPGPVLFVQERVGLNKKPFRMLKFRSMKVNSDENTGWTKSRDKRRTTVGALLRKTSLDELPQLINVLKGDMSLIGPRPELPHFVEQFRETVPLYMVKYQVRPGITGWAQVHGLRGDTSIPDRVVHDLWYIENWSFGLDLSILFRTVFGGMINRQESL